MLYAKNLYEQIEDLSNRLLYLLSQRDATFVYMQRPDFDSEKSNLDRKFDEIESEIKVVRDQLRLKLTERRQRIIDFKTKMVEKQLDFLFADKTIDDKLVNDFENYIN